MLEVTQVSSFIRYNGRKGLMVLLMADNLFRKYLWLVSTLKAFGPISYDRINERWHRSILNPYGVDLPKKTFHNHLEAIQETFGLTVVCDRRNGYRYSISEESQNDQWMARLLDTLMIQTAIGEEPAMRDRIVDYDRKGESLLPSLVRYINQRAIIQFRVFISFAEEREQEESKDLEDIDIKYGNFCPLGIVQASAHWYVIGMFSREGKSWHKTLAAFRTENMYDVSIMEGREVSDYPEGFSVREYVQNIDPLAPEPFFTQTVLLYSDVKLSQH